MSKIFIQRFTSLLVLASLAFSSLPQSAGQASSPPAESNSGAVLCEPGVYLETPQDCAPLGPSQYLTDNARLGLVLPPRPLQISHPDPALGRLPYRYFKVDATIGTAFYPSLDAAKTKSGASQIIPPGALLYVVYSERIDEHNYLLPSGAYMPGDGSAVSVEYFTEPYKFPGVEVHATPRNAFGFVIQPADVRREPNFLPYNPPIRQLKPYDIVQVYTVQRIEGYNWCLIGPDEWVLGRDVKVVTPNTTPPSGVTSQRWIDVNLAEQTLAVYDHGQMVYATVIATGEKPNYTRPGLFPIYKKLEAETMRGGNGTPEFYYLEKVPWTMYFDKARALHGAYWRANMGYVQSHGCVNLFPGDAHWIFDWAKEGDWVYVHDPSGETPTDPNFYGDGGA
jgi:hypothetical protein